MTIGSRIRERRKLLKMTQPALADRLGITTQAVSQWETGANDPTFENIKALAEIFEVDPLWIRGDATAAVPASASGPIEGVYRPPPQILGARDLPVYSAVEGGDGEMVVSTDPIEWVLRPWFLKEVKDGYAVHVVGESMVPVYEPGDLVIINPRLPVIRGKNAIFVSGEHQGDFKATVKRLLRVTADAWHVKQWNPPPGQDSEFALSKREWPKALRIVGKYEGY